MKRTLVPAIVVFGLAAGLAATPFACGGSQEETQTACNVEGLPDLADEALACAARAVDGGNNVAYWLLPLTPVVVADTGVVPYVIVAANTGEAAVASLLANATGEWFFEPDDGDPISIKQIAPNAGPAVEAGPGETHYFVGSLGIWGAGVPNLAAGGWVNLRLELKDADRQVSLRLRLPLRAERADGLDADCWRAITMHRDRPLRTWANQLPGVLLRENAEE